MAYKLKSNPWLAIAVQVMRPYFRMVGFPLPDRGVMVRRGACQEDSWWGQYTPGDPPEIVISSRIRAGNKAIDTLRHELCHVAADFKKGSRDSHGELFKQVDQSVQVDYKKVADRVTMLCGYDYWS